MYSDNLEFLQTSLKYLGFGENTLLNQQLEEQVVKSTEEFELYTEAFFDDDTKLEAKLYFRRSDPSNRYFLGKYDALLRYTDDEEKNKAQTFYILKGSGVTFKEAFNLLQGRAVNRDMYAAGGEKYNAWIQLNFEEKDLHNNYKLIQYRSQYRYELEKVLEKYPIRELGNEETKAALIRSLRRGNAHLVTFVLSDKSNKTEKKFIEANPRYKTIIIHSLATRAAQKKGLLNDLPWPENPDPGMTGPVNRPEPEEDLDPELETEITGVPAEIALIEDHGGDPVLATRPATRKSNRK